MSASAAIAVKQRLRREARIKENYDRISTTLAINDTKSTKNPTRILPDIPGFQVLSKVEIKKDTKEIEKNATYVSNLEDPNQEEEDYTRFIEKSTRPTCNSESFLIHKKRRFINWERNPETMQQELDYWKTLATKSHERYNQLEEDVLNNDDKFQTSRKILSNALKSSMDYNKQLKYSSKELLSICHSELNTMNPKRKRGVSIKDIVQELDDRQNTINESLERYMNLISSAKKQKTKDSMINNIISTELENTIFPSLPIVTLSLDELYYPEDELSIKKIRKTIHTPHCKIPLSTTSNISHNSNANVVMKEGVMNVSNTNLTSTRKTLDNTDNSNKILLPTSILEVFEKIKLNTNTTTTSIIQDDDIRNTEFISEIPLPFFDISNKDVIPSNLMKVISIKNDVIIEDSQEEQNVDIDNNNSNMIIKKEKNLIKTDVSMSKTTIKDNNTMEVFLENNNIASRTTSNNTTSSNSVIVTSHDLHYILTHLQETIRLNEISCKDVEFMFQDNRISQDHYIIDSILNYSSSNNNLSSLQSNLNKMSTISVLQQNKMIPNIKKTSSSSVNLNSIPINPTMEQQRILVNPYLLLNRSLENDWSSYINIFLDRVYTLGSIVTRKKKQVIDNIIEVSSEIRLRTPRGVSLFISPLSQYEDFMLGISNNTTIYRKQIELSKDCYHTQQQQQQQQQQGNNNKIISTYKNIVYLPNEIEIAEKHALERCSLQSCAAAADLKIRKLKTSHQDNIKLLNDSINSFKRIESIYKNVCIEEENEINRFKKELIFYGINKDNNDDMTDIINRNNNNNNNNNNNTQSIINDTIINISIDASPIVSSVLIINNEEVDQNELKKKNNIHITNKNNLINNKRRK